MRYLLLLSLVVACGKTPSGPPPVGQLLHDPEIFLHRSASRADTTYMRWYQAHFADPAHLLATVRLTGADSVCAYFLAPPTAMLYVQFAWSGIPGTNGFEIDTTQANNTYWNAQDLGLGNTQASNGPNSFCPVGMARDSVRP